MLLNGWLIQLDCVSVCLYIKFMHVHMCMHVYAYLCVSVCLYICMSICLLSAWVCVYGGAYVTIFRLVLYIRIFVQSLHSASDLRNDFSKSKPKFFSAPEIKLLILSICFSIIGVVTIGTYTSAIGDQSAYAERFVEYSNCLLCGNDPKCTMESTTDQFRVFANAVAQLAYCLLFAVNIMFTLNAADMSKISKVLCCACRQCKRTKDTNTTSTSVSAPNDSPFTKSQYVSETVVMKFTTNSSSAV